MTILRNITSKRTSVAEMRMVRWMSDRTFKDWIKKENIRGKLGVAPIEDKISYVYSRHIDVTVRRIDSLEFTSICKGRGRIKKKMDRHIKNDFKALNLINKIALARTGSKYKISCTLSQLIGILLDLDFIHIPMIFYTLLSTLVYDNDFKLVTLNIFVYL